MEVAGPLLQRQAQRREAKRQSAHRRYHKKQVFA